MSYPRMRSGLALALLGALWAPAALAQPEPDVNTPPPLSAICPAIDASYRLCAMDTQSPDCDRFVKAAEALGRLYLFTVERDPGRAHELTRTIWWECGSAPIPSLKGLLEKLGSPDARALLAQEPWRDLPGPLATAAAPLAPAPAPAKSPEPDCTPLTDPAAVEACEQRGLAIAEARYQQDLARCEALLPPPLRQQLAAGEAAWQRDRAMECDPGDGQTACLAEATRQRTASIARGNPPCAAGPEAPIADAREGHELGGRPTGLLPARWTPPQAGDAASQEVPFSFESFGGDEGQGRMETTLGDGGEHFAGDYLRIQQSTKGDLVTAMSVGWSGPEWQLWKPNGEGGWIQEGVSVGEFADFYTGKVVAKLRGDRGNAMRCHFTLKDPGAGLLEGGTGRCQVTDGGKLELAF
jgi:hypothetical protein